MSTSLPWLVRIPEIFSPVREELLARLSTESATPLGQDYFLIKVRQPDTILDSEWSKFMRWNLPMEHTWPCKPRKMEGFIEKAAQTLCRKFASRDPQGVFIGRLNPSSPDPYFKGLASNLRGRALQLFPNLTANTVEEQASDKPSLFCLVGKEGLFAGMHSPRNAQGFYPGGSLFIDRDAPEAISRAGAKIAEALHYLKLHRPSPPEGSHWLEIGAAPGGMTAELLARKQQVTAIDRAPLDKRLHHAKGLEAVLADAASFTPNRTVAYDALLSDLNGPPEESIAHIVRLSEYLKPQGLVIFTLKLPKVESLSEPASLFRDIVGTATAAGLALFAQAHLTGNRHEFTLFFEKR